MRDLNLEEGYFGGNVTIMGKSFRVIGIMQKKGSFLGKSQDSIVLIPFTSAEDLFPEARRQLAFMVQAESPALVPEAKAQITTTLRRRHHLGPNQPNDFRISSQDEVLQALNKISGIASGVLV